MKKYSIFKHACSFDNFDLFSTKREDDEGDKDEG